MMGCALRGHTPAAYDVPGRYRQDEINGFSPDLIDEMLDAADLAGVRSVLDAMAGDGNLTLKLFDFCRRRSYAIPEATVLEYSRVQSEFARQELAGFPARIVWGDVLSMASRSGGATIPDGTFDRVLIKSGNHEIPFNLQRALYRSIYRALKPGGLFVNLGFLFDDRAERDELREIARVKDTLAGMHEAVVNRYFLVRDEFYENLREAGFMEVRAASVFDYSIRSKYVAEQYFDSSKRRVKDGEFQSSQIKAFNLRRNGRIRFEGTSSLMLCPGEITVAKKPFDDEDDGRVFQKYPMDYLRCVEAHAQMLTKAASHISDGTQVLDLGCGIGLLAERLKRRQVAYRGVDISRDFIRACSERYVNLPSFVFEPGDITEIDPDEASQDAVTLLNTLNLPGMDAVGVLRKAHRALRPGGVVIVSGPVSDKSFTLAEPKILAQLERDGHVQGHEEEIRALREANARLLTERGNYWSAEGMVALLRHIGFDPVVRVDTDLYYGFAYLVVARR